MNHRPCFEELCRSVPLLSKTLPSSREKIMQSVVFQHVEKKNYLFHIRDQVKHIYIIREGYAVAERESQDHGTKAIFLLHSGDIVNEVILDHTGASISCYALTDLELVCFSKGDFLEILREDFSISKGVMDSMALKIRKLYRQVESTTKPTRLNHQVASRLWKFARDFGVQYPGYVEIPFEIPITLLANFVGSSRENVSRVVKRMTEEQILSIRYGQCRIYDLNGLKQFGAAEETGK